MTRSAEAFAAIMPQMRERVFQNFAQALIGSQDVDPVYPFLRSLYAGWPGVTSEGKLWHTILYGAFYRPDSSFKAFSEIRAGWQGDLDWREKEMLADLPISVERRGLRGGRVIQHIQSWIHTLEQQPSKYPVASFLSTGFTDDPIANYEVFWATIQTIKENGRWAAFKMAELLKKVHDFPLAAPDMRLQYCSGPLAGLAMLYTHIGKSPIHHPIDRLNRYGERAYKLVREVVPDADWETVETALCNFHSTAQGRYYVGHDLQELWEWIEPIPELRDAWDNSGLKLVENPAVDAALEPYF